MKSVRSHSSEAAAWTGIISHLGIAVLKVVVGFASGSKALIAGAMYDASDAAAAAAERLPQRRTGKRRKPRDAQGSSSNPVVSVTLSVLLLMAGLQTAFSSIRDLAESEPAAPGIYSLIAAVVALGLMEAIFQFQYRSARKHNRSEAARYAYDHKFSLYAALASLVGISGSMAGEASDLQFLLYMDPVASIVISCLVLYRAYRMIVESVYGSLVEELQHEDSGDFMDTVQRVHGVVTVEQLTAKEVRHSVTIDLVISVNPRITVAEAQEISDMVKALLLGRFAQVAEVHIQAVPYQAAYPYKSNHELPDNDASTLVQ
ncbi:cation diffusion facilitator family transporter [Paenibacillus sp. JX-17]|uniref:Cation diffusion facilitator family transporter n=1 Tax=Paenibacillus lacisoli TaxID=3064525 RepID=A0ABT9CFN5_9BACL|nr:cation diffusion facilitator family transporter [Paenibacillus sp. JX-17]MDO7908089.1 cation diffusion facilitator family transporter [Paenibacillus sp. JX-17]